MMLAAIRYQSRPVEPTHVEAVLLTEENLQDAADWWNSFPSYDPYAKRGVATVDTHSESGEPVLLVPFSGGGWYTQGPGDYLMHFGGGVMRGMTAEDFQRRFEPHALADPSLCSCLSPQACGTAEEEGGPLVWDSDCGRCGRPLTEQALAELRGH